LATARAASFFFAFASLLVLTDTTALRCWLFLEWSWSLGFLLSGLVEVLICCIQNREEKLSSPWRSLLEVPIAIHLAGGGRGRGV